MDHALRPKTPSPVTESPAIPLSSSHLELEHRLTRWLGSVAETKTLVRLVVAILKGPAINEERSGQLGRLVQVEARVHRALPSLALGTIYANTTPRESGLTLMGPNTLLAEDHLEHRRRTVSSALQRMGDEFSHSIETTMEHCECIGSTLELLERELRVIERGLRRRARDPLAKIQELLNEAAPQNTPRLLGENPLVPRVRGLVRLFSELLKETGTDTTVTVQQTIGWTTLSLVPATPQETTDANEGHRELLRLAAYLLDVSTRVMPDGTWHLALREPPTV